MEETIIQSEIKHIALNRLNEFPIKFIDDLDLDEVISAYPYKHLGKVNQNLIVTCQRDDGSYDILYGWWNYEAAVQLCKEDGIDSSTFEVECIDKRCKSEFDKDTYAFKLYYNALNQANRGCALSYIMKKHNINKKTEMSGYVSANSATLRTWLNVYEYRIDQVDNFGNKKVLSMVEKIASAAKTRKRLNYSIKDKSELAPI